jgi:hypothetical protein
VSDVDPIPVIEETPAPVLSYANLRGQQPSDSRFVCEILPDGVRLTEQPLPNAARLLRFAGFLVIIIGGAAVAAVINAVLGDAHAKAGAWAAPLLLVLFLVLPGWAACRQSHLQRTRPTVIEISGGMLCAKVPAVIFQTVRKKVTPTLNIRVIGRGFAYIRSRGKLGFIAGISLSHWTGLLHFIVANHPADECEWIARELTLGIQRSLESERTQKL